MHKINDFQPPISLLVEVDDADDGSRPLLVQSTDLSTVGRMSTFTVAFPY